MLNKAMGMRSRTIALHLFCCALAAVFLLCSVSSLFAAKIRVVPSVSRVSPGESFYIDIVVEDIPSEGLNAVQFRLNVDAPGADVAGVLDLSQSKVDSVSVVTPIVIGPAVTDRSGIGEFFWSGVGPHGVLVMDNESLSNGTALYTFAHTNGAVPPSGEGTIARFYIATGSAVESERIEITLTEVMLLNSGDIYPVEVNEGAVVELRCTAQMPDLTGLTLSEATSVLENAGLIPGNIYEIDNHDGKYEFGKVLAQSYTSGTTLPCETAVDLAVNSPPLEVGNAVATDKPGDENGTVVLSWTPSSSDDVAGYRVYLVSGSESLLQEISTPLSTGTEISGLPNGQSSRIRITAFDQYGNESQGVVVAATPLDDLAPRITLDAVADGEFYISDLTPVINVQDVSAVTIVMLLNGVPYDGSPITSDGDYTLTVTVTDSAGNSTTETISFVIDRMPPVITVTGIEKGKYYNSDVVPVVTVTDEHLEGFRILLNGENFVSGTTVREEGVYELDITASDKAGNSSSDRYSFYIDKTSPISSVTVGTPQHRIDNTLFVTGSTSFTLSGKDEGVVSSGIERLEYSLNSGEWTPYQSSFALSSLDDGEVLIKFHAIDRAGNIEPDQTLSVTIDNTPPVSMVVIDDPKYIDADMTYITSSTILRIETTDTGAGVERVEYRIDTSPWQIYAPFKVAGEGVHTIYYRASDYLRNASETGSLQVIVDDTPPVTELSISGPRYDSPAGILFVSSNTVFTLSATDDLSGVASIEYRIDGGQWTPYAPFGISVEGEHTIEFRSRDNLGNTEEIKSVKVTVDNSPPSTEISPGEPKFSSPDGRLFVSSKTLFTLSASDYPAGVARTEYRIDDGQWLEYLPFTLSGEGMHRISYRSIDNLGNMEMEKTLVVIVDDTAPVTTINVGDPRYEKDGDLYISAGTEIDLSATDEGSGVKRIEYSIDSSSFIPYTGAITLDSFSEGTHTITYRSVDNLGTAEDARQLTVILDRTPPQTTLTASDPLAEGIINTVAPRTMFLLTATDNLSGVREIQYRIDDGNWQTYMARFSLSGLNAGIHTISFRATDYVDNIEDEGTITLRLIVVEVTKKISSEPVLLVAAWRDHHSHKSKRHDRGRKHKQEKPFRKAAFEAISDILSYAGIPYYVPDSEEEFKELLRSGVFNSYLLIDFRKEDLRRELRESVYYGDGLVFINTVPSRAEELEDLFGVEFKGRNRTRVFSLILPASEISDEAAMLCRGRTVRAEISAETARGYGFAGDSSGTSPVIIFNQYGRGRAILFNFDLSGCYDFDRVSELLINSINYVAPREHYIRPLDTLPVSITVTNSEEPVTIKITESIPYGTTAGGVTPEANVTEEVITWQRSLQAKERLGLKYYLFLPDKAGIFTMRTDLEYDNSGAYRLYDTYELAVEVSYNSSQLLESILSELQTLKEELKSLSSAEEDDEHDDYHRGHKRCHGRMDKDRHEAMEKVSKAIRLLYRINTGADSRKDAERNIRWILKAADSVRDLPVDVTKIRLDIDELLKIWQKKWYLAKPEKPEKRKKRIKDHHKGEK